MAETTEPASASLRLRIAIVGGGIGGLALATFLASKGATGLTIDMYEANPSLTELGAGVGVWLRTWRILSSAGLAEGLQGIAPSGRDMGDGMRKAFEFRRADRDGPLGRSFYTMEVPFGVLALHRAEFQQVLAKHAIPPAVPHFGKRLVNYEYENDDDASSGLLLKFVDGSTAYADVLIGADGIRSPIRGVMLRRLAARGKVNGHEASSGDANLSADGKNQLDPISDLIEPIWSGTNVYRCLVPVPSLEKEFPGHRASKGPVCYFGKDKHVLAFPIMQPVEGEMKALVNLVAFVSEPSLEGTRISGNWVRPAPPTDLLSIFQGWEEEVQALIKLVESPLLWAIHTVRDLPCFSDAEGRVALLGDAAHAMTPHQGAGGGQAIEDAYVLAALLAHPRTTRSTLPFALRAYDAVRVQEAQRVVRSSRLNGRMYELNEAWDDDGASVSERVAMYEAAAVSSTVLEDDDEMRKLRRLAANIMAIHDWEWAPAPEEDQPERAVRLFKEALARSARDDN